MPASLPETPIPADQAPVRRRPWLLVVGAVLWILVGVTAFVLVRARTQQREAASATATANAPQLEPIPENPSVIDVSGPRLRRPVKPSDLNAWDPNGVRDFALTDQAGRTVTKADLLGKPWIVCFIFTQCRGPCVDVTNSMVRLQKELEGVDVRLVSISVDPERDTPEKLADYAAAFGADPEKWLFLTGDKTDIYDLTLKSFLMPVEEVTGPARLPGFEVVHTTNILLVDERGVVQAKYDGKQPHEVGRLVARLAGPAVAELPEALVHSEAKGLSEVGGQP